MNKITFFALLLFAIGAALMMLPPDIYADKQVNKQNDNILHIYSSRHYETDQILYDRFTEKTGIKIQKVEGKGDALIARLTQEGKAGHADLFITADAGRLWRANEAGLFAPIQSEILDKNIPDNFKNEENSWFGFSKRARIFAYNPEKISPGLIQNYEDLVSSEIKGKLCVRSSSNIYNLSLMASFIELKGEKKSKEWAQGVLENLARKPQGGDTDQMRAVAAGVCDIALVNSYYYFRLLRSNKEEDQKVAKTIKIIFPNQETDGTHINISGGGVLKNSDNKKAAIQFLEYLSGQEAQTSFALGNNEYPIIKDLVLPEKILSLKDIKKQDVHSEKFGTHQTKAQMIFDSISFP